MPHHSTNLDELGEEEITEGYSTTGALLGRLSDLNTPEHSKASCKVEA